MPSLYIGFRRATGAAIYFIIIRAFADMAAFQNASSFTRMRKAVTLASSISTRFLP